MTAGEATVPRPRLVAVASQNGRTVTPHAGKTRRFLIFTIDAEGHVEEAGRFDLPKAMAVHGWGRDKPHPLYAVDVLVVATAGESFRRKLAEAGVEVVTAASEDPRTAVEQVATAATSVA